MSWPEAAFGIVGVLAFAWVLIGEPIVINIYKTERKDK